MPEGKPSILVRGNEIALQQTIQRTAHDLRLHIGQQASHDRRTKYSASHRSGLESASLVSAKQIEAGQHGAMNRIGQHIFGTGACHYTSLRQTSRQLGGEEGVSAGPL